MTAEEWMQLPDDERRNLIMSAFGEVFPEVQRLIIKLSIFPITALTQEEAPALLEALYLASIEYTRYCNEAVPEGAELH